LSGLITWENDISFEKWILLVGIVPLFIDEGIGPVFTLGMDVFEGGIITFMFPTGTPRPIPSQVRRWVYEQLEEKRVYLELVVEVVMELLVEFLLNSLT
jgi:hypothetical protein